MALRRDRRANFLQRIREFRNKEEETRRQRLKTDAAYRAQMEQRRRPSPTSVPSGRKLPPWPLGPRGDVDGHFQKVILHSPAAYHLMRSCPGVAAEVLLAVSIEGSPEEQYGSGTRFDQELGLDYDREGYPTAYWKSPFFAFLQIDPDVALAALLQLINFCTSRWEHGTGREEGSHRPTTSVILDDGTAREFVGDYLVFAWSQSNSHHNGQLFSALAALEKWLCGLIDREVDITGHIDNLLRNSNSVAVIGVLINIGKYRTELFKGPEKWHVHSTNAWRLGVISIAYKRNSVLIAEKGGCFPSFTVVHIQISSYS
jgi:hypothetical protein